jgi:hypothetical protein
LIPVYRGRVTKKAGRIVPPGLNDIAAHFRSGDEFVMFARGTTVAERLRLRVTFVDSCATESSSVPLLLRQSARTKFDT